MTRRSQRSAAIMGDLKNNQKTKIEESFGLRSQSVLRDKIKLDRIMGSKKIGNK